MNTELESIYKNNLSNLLIGGKKRKRKISKKKKNKGKSKGKGKRNTRTRTRTRTRNTRNNSNITSMISRQARSLRYRQSLAGITMKKRKNN